MRLHVVVRGRVQGVGFRWFVHEHATGLALAGWVKNRVDGAVEVEVDVEDSAVARLREALVEGPPGASVTSVDELAPSADALPRPFAIVR